MRDPYENLVVVITGASSGIGRASATALAVRGARLVLAARNEAALRDTLAACERAGGQGITRVTDMRDAAAVDALCDAAVDAYGRIDVWINNAAVSLFGRFEEVPREEFEAVIQTNLLGYANGARAAIRQFREQGHGHLINVSSVVGLFGQPFTSAYTTSKWAIQGLTETLRNELADAPRIAVSALLPASIDTPIFQHAGNYTGRQIKAMTPVYPASEVADAVLQLTAKPCRQIIVGNAGKMIATLCRISPTLTEVMMRRQTEKDHFDEGRGVPVTKGIIHAHGQHHYRESGGWIEHERRKKSDNSLAALALGAVALSALILMTQRATR